MASREHKWQSRNKRQVGGGVEVELRYYSTIIHYYPLFHYSTWLVFREHKWTQHTVSPQKKSQTDDLFKSLWSWRGTKTGRETLCLFLD